jgi:CHRD domain
MKHSRRLVGVAFSALGLGFAFLPALRSEAAPISFGAVALAAEESPAAAAADSGAVGVVDFTIDPATGDICVQSTLSGLSGPIAASHIHSGGVGTNGPVFVTLPTTANTVSGCVTATAAQAQAIVTAPNSFYFNVHTAASPGGAMRGQLSNSTFNATLTGAAETPAAGDPDGSGQAVVAVNSTANRACVYLAFSGLDLPASLAHIHSGATGVAGPPVVTLTAPTVGLSASCGSASAAVISNLAATPASHYVNVHTTPFPAGAIRGQLAARSSAGVPVPIVFPTIPVTSLTSSTAAASAPTATGATPTTVAPAATTPAATTPAATTPPTTIAATTPPPTTAALPSAPPPAEPTDQEPTFTG